MRLPSSGGGLHAIAYTFSKARQSGGFVRMYRALRSRNACKTCALGMGGQKGGMVNEAGHFPEFCKKSVQALAADLQAPVPQSALTAPFDYLAGLTPRQLEGLGRLTSPLVAEPGATRFRIATWDEAIACLTAGLEEATPERSFFYASGRSSNEAGFLMHLMARAWGTNNVNNCSFFCHQASGIGLTEVLGASTGTVQLEDLQHTDLVLLIGGNPASNHPRLLRTLMELKRRGGKVVVINPLRERGLERFRVPSDPRSLLFGTTIADLYLQPHIGGDIALLQALARMLLDRGAVDHGWLAAHTEGSAAVLAELAKLDLDELLRQAGITRAEAEQCVELLVASKATVLAWAMGITHHLHGVDNVRAIAQLALLRGMCGRQGAGLLPLRGHSNIQGLGTIGFTPTLRSAIFERLQARYRMQLPTTPGLDTMGSLERAAAGGIDVAWCLGGNLYGSSPDALFAQTALASIGQLVHLTTTLNTGHVVARGRETWVLPVLARDEEPQPTTQESMFSYVRMSDGGEPHHPGPWPESRIIAEVAKRLLGEAPIPWSELADHSRIRQVLAAVVPGFDQMAALDATRTEFHIPGRVYREPTFRTGDGRAKLAPVALPAWPALPESGVRLMTIRSEGQFNSVVYEESDRYRGTSRRDVIMLAPADIARLGLTVGQRVAVSSSIGRMEVVVAETRIRAGNAAMYYPEANVLVPRATDPRSGTPSFKHIVVAITPL